MQPHSALSSVCGTRARHVAAALPHAAWHPRPQRPIRPRRMAAASADAAATPAPKRTAPSTSSRKSTAVAHTWRWRGAHDVFYERTGRGPIPVVLIHGMGACHESWRRLVGVLDVDALYSVFALDLLGFGDSERPPPGRLPPGHTYCFDTWAVQLADFVEQVVGGPALLVGNSAGGLAALQAAVASPHLVRGLLLLDCSLRRQHVRNQHPLMHPLVAALQWGLSRTALGHAAVDWVLHQPGCLARILGSGYADPSCLSPELLASWTAHLAAPGSRDVLLDVITNSSGPLPQDLLPLNTVPTLVIWGGSDPWEPVQAAQSIFCGWPLQFAVLPGVGHFPHDEAPELVAQLLDEFAAAVVAAECEGGGSAAAAAAVAARGDGCTAVWEEQHQGPMVAGFPLRGLMAAAELDAKV